MASPALLLAILGALAVAAAVTLLVTGPREDHDPLAFRWVVGFFLLAAYAADIVFIAATGRFGLDAKHWWWIGATLEAELSSVAGTAALFIFGIALGGRIHVRLPALFARLAGPPREIDRRRLLIALGLFGVISVLAITQAYASALSSAAGIIALIGYKQSVFAGKGYLLLLALLYKSAVLLWSADLFRRDRPSRGEWLQWACALGIGVVIDLATGTRSNLLLANLLIVAHLWHKLRRPLGGRALIGGIAGVVVLALVVRVLTRDVAFSENRGQNPLVLIRGAATDLADAVLFDEMQSTDAQLVAIGTVTPSPAPFWGGTIAAALMAPAPRKLFPWKPLGGNAAFTDYFFPTRYQETKVEYAVSLMTELWLNGRLPLVLVGGILFGAMGRLIDAGRGVRDHLLVCTVQSLLLWRSISLLRGDLFNWFNNLFMATIALTIAYLAITVRRGTRSLP